jgi:uncharacterized membrane protein (DUF106 family)
MHRNLAVVAIVALIVITAVDFLVARKLPRSRHSPAWFLWYIFLTSILVSAVGDLLSRSH